MKRFAFPLQRLLQLRETAEQERARALGDARRAEEERRRRHEESLARTAQAADQIASRAAESNAAGLLCHLGLTLARSAAQAEADRAALETAREAAEAEQARFEQARQERRVVERLREQKHAAWSADAARQEQHEIDEIGLRITRNQDRDQR